MAQHDHLVVESGRSKRNARRDALRERTGASLYAQHMVLESSSVVP